MEQAHHHHLFGIEIRAHLGQNVTNNRCPQAVLGNRLAAGAQELKSGARRPLEHSNLEQEIRNRL